MHDTLPPQQAAAAADTAADVAVYRGHVVSCTAMVSPEGECFGHAVLRDAAGGFVAVLTATDKSYGDVDAAKARGWHEARLWLDRHEVQARPPLSVAQALRQAGRAFRQAVTAGAPSRAAAPR